MQAQQARPTFYPTRGNRASVWVLATIFSGLIIGIAIFVLVELRDHALNQSALVARNLATSVEQTFEGLLDAVDNALSSTADEIARQMTDGKLDTPALNIYLTRQYTRLPHISYIRATNENGDVLYGLSTETVPHNNADRAYFIALKKDPDAGMHISNPLVSRTDNQWVWPFIRRINKPDGSFGGVVFAAIPVDEIERMLAKVEISDGSSIALRDAELGLIARNALEHTKSISTGDQTISNDFREALILDRNQGNYTSGLTSIDNVHRLHFYHLSSKYGFTTNVGMSVDSALTDWMHQVWVVVTLVLGTLLLVFAFARYVSRSFYRQEKYVAELESGQQMLRESESRFRNIIEASPIPLAINDSQGNVSYLNDAFVQKLGYSRNEIHNLTDWWTLAYPDPDYRTKVSEIYLKNLAAYRLNHKPFAPMEVNIRCKDGISRTFIVSVSDLLESSTDEYLIILQDISEQQKVEQNLRIAATAFEAKEGIIVTDVNCVILRVNRTFSEITGYTEADIIGKTPTVLSSGRQDAAFYADMWSRIHATGAWEGEIWNKRKDGVVYPEHLTIASVKDASGALSNYVATFADITVRKQAQEQVNNLAFYDPLTLLPNRRLLLDRLQQASVAVSRSGKVGALLFIDLDDFKTLNDTMGHDVGDLLLKQVAQRLVRCVREGDTVARFGGDEFVVMLEDLSEQSLEAAAHTELVGYKILEAMGKYYQLGTRAYRITASIGITLFNTQNRVTEEIMKQADIAMYQAKQAGRNCMRFFDPVMQEGILARTKLERELHEALEKHQFRLHYQIQVDHAGRAFGAEALIRWLHPERGMVLPMGFISLAEESGLILPIGHWVLEAACMQLKKWQPDPLTRDLTLSVNVSAAQFHQSDFVEQVKILMQRHGITPNRLKLEPTESVMLDNVDGTVVAMKALKELGVQLSLDDFGTGYSSLQYLKRLPLDQLKIDQSFVRDIVFDESDKAIVTTIIAMAKNLRLDVIAEGVETRQQQQFLLDNGCLHFQGYLFGKPVPIETFEAQLISH